MAIRRLVAIGASSGGIDALRQLAATLPTNFPVPICVVVHTPPQAPGLLHVILNRAGTLPAVAARNDERLVAGRIYVAPPDYHLLIEPGVVRLSKGPRENRFRPAIDPLFRSAAQVYGPGAIGVILTGNLDDGTSGLRTIKQLGGLAVVQDPRDALYPSMPQSALAHVNVDHIVPLADIAPLLLRLASDPVDDDARKPLPKEVEVEVKIAREHNAIDAGLLEVGDPSSYTCPECHGVLLRMKEADPMRFRCHTGHAYSSESLLAAVSENIEASLWTAIRALEEGALLLEHMADDSRKRNNGDAAARLASQVASARADAEAVRKVATDREGLTSGVQSSAEV